jgi:hypothetical protein
MSIDELNNIGIRQWPAIRAGYGKPDLLLGNGFSINQNSNFTYSSLFGIFLNNSPANIHSTVNVFQTTNFELILEHLTYARKVNESLGLDIVQIQNVIDRLKEGLVSSIRQVHPTVSAIDWSKLQALTVSLDNFNDIFTTNYDLFLYHIIMKAKDRYVEERKKGTGADPNIRPYNDYFWGRHNAPAGHLEFVDYQHYPEYKHIYYLHGALFIFADGLLNLKITSVAEAELINVIEQKISVNKFPLFVSEGTAADKMGTINRSPYLRFCLDQLSATGKPLLVYGNSLSTVDSHIVDAIKKHQRSLIYAIYVNGRSEYSLSYEKYGILQKFPSHYKIEFVDSSSIF